MYKIYNMDNMYNQHVNNILNSYDIMCSVGLA
jgi:hypothetical protein